MSCRMAMNSSACRRMWRAGASRRSCSCSLLSGFKDGARCPPAACATAGRPDRPPSGPAPWRRGRGRDRLEVGAEVVRALDDDDPHLLGIDADHAQQLAVEQLLLAARRPRCGCRRSRGMRSGRAAPSGRASSGPFSVQRPSLDASTLKRPRPAGRESQAAEGRHRGAEREVDLGADAGRVRDPRGGAVVQQPERDPAREAPPRAGASSACSMPVVLLSPPAPGLSWVSAMTTGARRSAASASARATASRASSISSRHSAPARRLRHRAAAGRVGAARRGPTPPARTRRSRRPESPCRSSAPRRTRGRALELGVERLRPARATCSARSAEAGTAAARACIGSRRPAPTRRASSSAARAPVSAMSTCG